MRLAPMFFRFRAVAVVAIIIVAGISGLQAQTTLPASVEIGADYQQVQFALNGDMIFNVTGVEGGSPLPPGVYRANASGENVAHIFPSAEYVATGFQSAVADPTSQSVYVVHADEIQGLGADQDMALWDGGADQVQHLDLGTGMIFDPGVSPSGGVVAFYRAPLNFWSDPASTELGMKLEVHWISSGETEVLSPVVVNPDVPVIPPAWSPSGDQIAVADSYIFAQYEPVIHIYTVSTSSSEEVGIGSVGSVAEVVWPTAHNLIVSGYLTTFSQANSPESGLYSLELATGDRSLLRSGLYDDLSLSPNRDLLRVHWVNPQNDYTAEQMYLQLDGTAASPSSVEAQTLHGVWHYQSP